MVFLKNTVVKTHAEKSLNFVYDKKSSSNVLKVRANKRMCLDRKLNIISLCNARLKLEDTLSCGMKI